MNKNYIKGVRKERYHVNKARNDGKIAFRSAGSHSPIDVCIIDPIKLTIEFIQCKPNSMSENMRNALENEMSALNNEFMVSFKVV